jgi:hypothetical protein
LPRLHAWFIFKPVPPASEYQQRLQACQSRAANYEKIHYRYGNFRLLVFVFAVLIAWLSLYLHRVSAWWLVIPLAAFMAAALFHSRVLRRRDLAQRAVAFYSSGLARIEERWIGNGQTGDRFSDPHHVYAADFDLFGRGGMFELLSTARTRMGEETLAGWLLKPSSAEQIRIRHGAVTELRRELDLREDLAVLGEDAGVGVYPAELAEWAESSNRLDRPLLRVAAILLPVLFISSVAVWGYWGTITPLLLVILFEAAIFYRLRKPINDVLHGAEHALHDLGLLSGVLARIERHTFQSARLLELQAELTSPHGGASQAIARLRTLADLIDSRDNMFVRVFDVPLMYSVHLALSAERWRKACGQHVCGWLQAIGELEGLLSLSGYSYEHPADEFPDLVAGGALFEAQDLGHPLLPLASCVRNNVRLNGETRVLLVSGSNMSGKSTLLRAVGINVVLAMAGAPVRAAGMRLTALQAGASIRINDSLQEGSSRFYAEITRLRELLDLASKETPLLFLMDELLQGTNSTDRRVGAEGIVRALLARGAIGLLTTHDLALTEIGGVLDGHVRNVHFQDEFAAGKITFDYRLRDGVVTRSNGLELMRSVGLDV